MIKVSKQEDTMNKLLFSVLSSTLLLASCASGTPASSVSSVASTSSSTQFSGLINVYTRDTSSGTRAGFMETIGFREAIANDAVLAARFIVAGNQEQVAAAQTDPLMIGYVSLSTYNPLLFKGFNYEGVEPNETNTLNGTYKLARRFNWMLRDDYSVYGADGVKYEQLSNAYVAYLGSREGKAIIAQGGGIVDLTTGSPWDTLRVNHPVCAVGSDNRALTLKIGGSDSVESLSKRIGPAFAAACGNVSMEYNHTGSSNGYRGTNGNASGINDALSIHVGYASREFLATEPALKKGTMAIDAIVAIGHKSNPIKNLTGEQLTQIYKGLITDWRELNP
jgi:phosphate transport system substrate-binding protein